MPLSQTVSSGQQNRALGLSTFAFTICFAVWTIFAIIGIEIKAELGLNDTQFGLLVGTPILTGSLVRLFLGVWTDQYGGRIVFPLTMLASAASTMLLSHAVSYVLMLLAALGLGLAGGGFAVGVASHGIGTARAFQVSDEAGTFAGIAMGLNGALTSLIFLLLAMVF